MSRHRVSNQAQLAQIISSEFTNNAILRHRSLVIVERSTSDYLIEFTKFSGGTFVPSTETVDRSDRISAFLGKEWPQLTHLVADPVDAGLLAAMVGTITGGGILVLGLPFVIPSLENSPQPDAEEQHTEDDVEIETPSKNELPTPTSRFNRRLARLIAELESRRPHDVLIARFLTHYDRGTRIEKSVLSNESWDERKTLKQFGNHKGTTIQSQFAAASKEQDALLKQGIEHLSSTDRGFVRIMGKRGRGKTTLLARLANWLFNRNIQYRITALHPTALSSFHKQTDHDSAAFFVTPHNALLAASDILFVDEAGNLSIDILSKLAECYPQLVFSTTVEGYEQAGRAFELRFEELSRKHTSICSLLLTPVYPWRWLPNDPIEELIDTLVLNRTTTTTTTTTKRFQRFHSAPVNQFQEDRYTKMNYLIMKKR